MSDYVEDLKLQTRYGENVKKLLPQNVKTQRDEALNQVCEYINSEDFKINVFKKNWIDEDETLWSMEYLNNKDFLKERADILLTKTYLSLKEIYKNTDEIIIPFSGGRDSTCLLSVSLAFFPDKEYKLVTVLNGMSEQQQNVLNQSEYIKELFSKGTNKKPKIENIFIDASENTKKYVLDNAEEEAQSLGAPSVCSSCKIVMEKEIWSYLLNKKTPFLNNILNGILSKKQPVLMGYTVNQQNQNWMEQTKVQIGTMQKEAKKFGIQTISPLFHIIEEPYDSSLLLGALGVGLKHHKSEMKCFAGGLNPKTLDTPSQKHLTELKNQQTRNIPIEKNTKIYYNPSDNIETVVDLRGRIKELKKDSEYTKGAF